MWAVRGEGENARKAADLLNESDRVFLSSILVKAETIAKPIYLRDELQVELYEALFSEISEWIPVDSSLVLQAYSRMCEDGLGTVDSMHIEAAVRANADEFVTVEKPEKSIYRAKGIVVRRLT
jgi:hypothetical protein